VTDAPDRERIRRHARARAERMGLRTAPDPAAEAAAEVLPTENLFALQGLLVTGRLTPGQAAAARRRLADAAAAARETDPNTPGDDAA
jgi:hypothetical protein